MPSVLKISEAATMALHAVAMLAKANGEPVATKTIAHRLCCSEAHLSKVLQRLTKADILGATRGPKGGFVMAKPPEQTTLLEVFETIDGHMSEDKCLFDESVCGNGKCIMGTLLVGVNHQVRDYFANTTVAAVNCDLKVN